MMKTILLIFLAFVAITSILSGSLMMSDPNGSLLNLSPELLKPTPFKNFLIPGLLLTVIVGGINLTAVIYNLQRNNNRYNWAIAGGLAITGWIIAEMILLQLSHWLHYAYLIAGVLIILLSYQLKGKWAA